MGMINEKERDKLYERLNKMRLDKVKRDFESGIWGGRRRQSVQLWIQEQESKKSESIKEQELRHQKESNEIAKHANLISWRVLVLSLLAFIVSIYALFRS